MDVQTPADPATQQVPWPVTVAGVRLQPLEGDDGPRLQQLFDSVSDDTDAFGEPGHADAVGTFIARPEGCDESAKLLVGMWRSDDLVGVLDTIMGYPTDEEWTVGLLLVDGRFRRQGIGSSVVSWLEQLALARGARTVRVVLRQTNRAGREFVEQRGYAPCSAAQEGSPWVLAKGLRP